MTRERDTFGQEEKQKQLNMGWGGGGKCGRWRGGAGGGGVRGLYSGCWEQGSAVCRPEGSGVSLLKEHTAGFCATADSSGLIVAWNWAFPAAMRCCCCLGPGLRATFIWGLGRAQRVAGVCRSESLNGLLPFSSAASQWQFQDCSYKGYACVTEMNAVYTNSSVKIDRYPHALHLFIISTYFFIVCVCIFMCQRIFESQFFLSTLWGLGILLRSWGLVAK